MTHVLIVDDHADNRYYLEALVTGNGWTADSAGDGAEALDRAHAQPPDLIVSDLLMPVMDGYLLLRSWKADPVLRRIPFVVYTATYTDAADERLALDLGADAFILKPTEPADLIARLREVVSATAATPVALQAPTGDDHLEQYSAALIRKLEEKTRQLEAVNRRLVDAQRVAHLGSWESDLRGGDATWSDEMERILEIDNDVDGHAPAAGPSHQRLLAVVHPDDRPAVEAALAGLDAQEGPQELDHRLLMPDGRVKYVTVRWEVVRDETRTAVRALGTCQDVTERRLAEIEMHRASTLLHAVADGTTDALFVKDLDGRYLFFNESSARRVGRTVDEVVGSDDRVLFGVEEADQIRETDRRVMTSGETITIDESLTSNGVTRTFLTIKAPYRDPAGNVIGLVGISRDVTERKRAEVALRESEQRQRAAVDQLTNVLDHTLDIVCSFDLEGHFLQVNKASERVLGYPPAELVGTTFMDLVLPADRAKTRRLAAEVMDGGMPLDFENRFVGRDGRITHLHWVALWSPQEQTMFCVGRDVTENKHLEAQILRAQRMESIGTLAGGIAHDLNNALAPILMSIDLLRMDEHDQRRLAILSTIDGSARRGADMVRQLLSFARGVERNPVDTDLAPLIAEVGKIADETFLKTIRVLVDVSPDVWLVHSEPTQIHQVLLNLCVNARDAMPGGGTLTLTAHNVEITERDVGASTDAHVGPYVLVRVADTGTGMPADILDRAFEPFFTTKAVGRGTGLGLSTSLAIVTSHGGFVRATSTVGVGTTIDVYLPASPDAVVSPSADSAPHLPRGHGELVLVVDDEVAVREVTQQTLEAFGYRSIVAADGAEALRIYAARGSEIAVVLTDMMMPNTDGPTTIAELMRIDPTVRIVAASGLNEIGMAAKAAALGVEHFVPKPFDAEALLAVLELVLGG